MSKRRSTWLWRPDMRRARLLLLVAVLAVVSVFALSPMPLTEQVLSWQDKAEHVFAFLVLTLLSAGLWQSRWLLVGWSGFAAFIELGQSFMPGRTASWGDWLASTGGVLLALLLHRGWRWWRRISRRQIGRQRQQRLPARTRHGAKP